MVAGAAFTYNTKHQVEAQLSEVRKIEAMIRFEQDSLTILKADWSLLTQPARLQKLTEIYQDELQLAPLDAHQVVGVDDLPAKPVEMEIIPSTRVDGMAEGKTDKVTTGGVVR
ncbi:hypothetical protein [Mesorhizobium sp. J428]|uniref:cell division protein FtsL n=1 Tax=Mesorhizobium sp. J428 TaxID=2898440 RepID=UPI002151A0DB|nr:hypothetical protein [Mesorhizobium sp. J428]MCR5855343.1 hypothetical protein [Mesorhizobium sp. J428]